MDARGWVPATAGNISIRLDPERIAITRSGGHKGFLDAESVMQVDLAGQALTAGARPSAETLLHCQIYRLFPQAGAVLHGHSVAGTVLGMTDATARIRLAGYEVLKAFEGQTTHEVALDLPVFDNDQDMQRLAAVVEPAIRAGCAVGLSDSRPWRICLGARHADRAGAAGGAGVPARLRAGEKEAGAMSRLTVYRDDAPGQPVLATEDPDAIARELQTIGVRFERWAQPRLAVARRLLPKRSSTPIAPISTG